MKRDAMDVADEDAVDRVGELAVGELVITTVVAGRVPTAGPNDP